jgi:hypothetical protein
MDFTLFLGGLLTGLLIGLFVGARTEIEARDKQLDAVCEVYCAPAAAWRVTNDECICPDKTLKLHRGGR